MNFSKILILLYLFFINNVRSLNDAEASNEPETSPKKPLNFIMDFSIFELKKKSYVLTTDSEHGENTRQVDIIKKFSLTNLCICICSVIFSALIWRSVFNILFSRFMKEEKQKKEIEEMCTQKENDEETMLIGGEKTYLSESI